MLLEGVTSVLGTWCTPDSALADHCDGQECRDCQALNQLMLALNFEGQNDGGQLGDGTTLTRAAPVPVSGGEAWSYISAGNFESEWRKPKDETPSHTCAIRKADGSAWCWGEYWDDFIPSLKYVNWYGLQRAMNVDSMEVGNGDFCYIERCLRLAGSNKFYQLGDGTSIDRYTPTLVLGGGSWVSIGTGYAHTCGIQLDGTAWCWGELLFMVPRA
jgi:hypothetical protein